MTAKQLESKRHPRSALLALYSTGDLSPIRKLFVGQHLMHCGECARAVQKFQQARSTMRTQANTGVLTPFENRIDWARLESEMLGNIAVGVAAARCIEKVRPSRRKWASAVWAVTALSALFVIGWFTHIPSEQNAHLVGSIMRWARGEHLSETASSLKATAEGISVRSQDVTLVMRSPHSATVSVLGSSAVTARYVDENTGQVTIANVYGQ